MALLVEVCCYFASCEKLLSSDFPNQAGQMALLVRVMLPRFIVFSTKRAQWHCWSGIFTKDEPNHSGQLALLVEACFFFGCVPSQSGHDGAVGRDV